MNPIRWAINRNRGLFGHAHDTGLALSEPLHFNLFERPTVGSDRRKLRVELGVYLA